MKTQTIKPLMLSLISFILFYSCKKENTEYENTKNESTFSADGISADVAPGISNFGSEYTMLVLQPNETEGQDTWIDWYAADPSYANGNAGSIDQFKCFAWTIEGSPVYSRSLIRFNGLESILSMKKIVYAKMFLYGLSSSPVHLPLGNSYYPGSPYESYGPNDVNVQRITSPWDENSVTWNTQPSFTSVNKSEIPPSKSQWNYNTSVEVTKMVRYFVNNPSRNYGFMLSLANETPYHAMGFYTSEYTITNRRPKLVVVYK